MKKAFPTERSERLFCVFGTGVRRRRDFVSLETGSPGASASKDSFGGLCATVAFGGTTVYPLKYLAEIVIIGEAHCRRYVRYGAVGGADELFCLMHTPL